MITGIDEADVTAKRKNNQSGAALVEFVLVVPLLLLFLFGIIEFSIILYDNAVLTNASREAARKWIVYDDTAKMTTTDVETVVNDYSSDRLISFNPGSIITTITNPADASTSTRGQTLTVTVTYDYGYFLLPGLMRGILPTITLKAETVMRAE